MEGVLVGHSDGASVVVNSRVGGGVSFAVSVFDVQNKMRF
jgi:hypothetical protein